ncbi:TonB-dependent receptor [Spirosoma sp. RP8]|uniref:TonB-dependent receptor n=1 Tax=Spirosoma liriopis TaxID=2937440 RepID=A0ABT0HSH5_9BACT|nr:TonB-dependent receptor [Spirosoma liriopis]
MSLFLRLSTRLRISAQVINRSSVSGIVCLLAGPAWSQSTPPDTVRNRDLTEVVVTATRSEVRRDLVPQQITVLSRHDIDQTPATDVTDLLKKLASVNVIQYPSLSSGVGIRGFRPQFSGLNQRTLLLIDGRPAGATNLSTIGLNNAERVEVLKGPASALYGSQAMGGVINVITRRSKGPVHGNAFAEYGSFQTYQAGGNVGGNLTKRLDFDASLNYFKRAQDYKLGSGNFFRDKLDGDQAVKNYSNKPAETIDDRKDDGQVRPNTKLTYYSGALRVGYQLSTNWRVDARGEKFIAKDVESPGDITYGTTQSSLKDADRQAGEVAVSGQVGAHKPVLRVFASGENSFFKTTNVSGKPVTPYQSSSTENRWVGIQLKDNWQLGPHTLTVGYDYLDASTQSRSWNDATTERAPSQPNYAIRSSALYAQGLLHVYHDRLILQPGIRYDNITFDVKETPLLTTFKPGKATTPFVSPSLGAVVRLLPGLQAKGTVGRAFVTPDAFNVAGYSETRTSAGKITITTGNSNLTNENSVSYDAGLTFSRPKTGFSAGVTYFHTNVKDRIARVVTQVNEAQTNGDVIVARATYVNAADSEISGLEYELAYDFGALSNYRYSLQLFANATSMFRYTETIVGTDRSVTQRDIMNVAKQNWNAGLDYNSYKGLRARLLGRYVGHRKDTDFTDAANPEIVYPAYLVIDVSASMTVAKQHTIGVQIANLTDENYYEKRGYNLPGRSISLRYTLAF